MSTMKEDKIPIIWAEPRIDSTSGLKFYCMYCKREHLHGKGEGHRIAHCTDVESPYYQTGYILRVRNAGTKQD